jgi:hypothetical protein
MKITAHLVMLAIAGALFLLAAFNVKIQTLDFVALGLAFFSASFVVERWASSRA